MILQDSVTGTMVTGTISDSNGHFRLTDVPYGSYIMAYSFIGYEKQLSKPFVISKQNPQADLGTLSLGSSLISMDEVTLTAERSMMINKFDRKVFNIQKDIQAQTGTVTNLLQNIPSVSVDMDGNISLRGSGNVTILINGRPSVMSGAPNLQQMPASLIERIEVITNPSARYKPDGTAGIINIILKKEKKTGFNGIAGANIGSNDRYNANLQLNYSTGGVNIFGSYGFRQGYRQRTGELSSETIDTATGLSSWLFQNSDGMARPQSHLMQLGIDWDISEKDAAGIKGVYNFRDVARNEITENLYQDDDLNPTESYTRYRDGREDEEQVSLQPVGACHIYHNHLLLEEIQCEGRATG